MSGFDLFWQNLYQPIRIGAQIYDFSWAVILFEFLTPMLAFVILAILGKGWLAKYLAKKELPEERQGRFKKIYRNIARLVFLLMLVLLGSRFFEVRVIRVFEDVFSFITKPLYKAGATELSILTIILALPVLYLAILLGRAARTAFEKSNFIKHRIIEKRRHHIATLVRYSITVTILLLGLSVIGIDFSSIGYFLLVLALGVILGFYRILAEFFAGVVIAIGRLVQEGDFVSVRTPAGTVEGKVGAVRLLAIDLVQAAGGQVSVSSTLVLHGVLARSESDAESVALALSLAVPASVDLLVIEQLLGEIVAKQGDLSVLSTNVQVCSLQDGKIALEWALSFPVGTDLALVRAALLRSVALEFRRKGVPLV